MNRPAATGRADLRLRLFDGFVRRAVAPIGDMTDRQLAQARSRTLPDNLLSHAVFGRPARDVEVTDRRIECDGWSIPLRIYRPARRRPGPILVFFHGGGWVVGNVTQSTWMCGEIARQTGVTVVSAGYRLAPEHPFPTAVDDAYEGLCWIAAHGRDLGGDPSRLAVMGASAGGNLAAVACQRARDRGAPDVALQVLLYPSVDVVHDAGDRDALDDAPMLTAADRVAYLDLYTQRAVDLADPRLSPLRAETLAALPPALVITAEHDPLRDEGMRYARRLRDDGVASRHTDYAGMCHGFLSFPGLAAGARQAVAEISQVLTTGL